MEWVRTAILASVAWFCLLDRPVYRVGPVRADRPVEPRGQQGSRRQDGRDRRHDGGRRHRRHLAGPDRPLQNAGAPPEAQEEAPPARPGSARQPLSPMVYATGSPCPCPLDPGRSRDCASSAWPARGARGRGVGAPTFRVRNKIFAMFAAANDHHGARPGRRLAEGRARRSGGDGGGRPRLLLLAPYVGPKGWIGVWLDGVVEWNDIAEFLRDSYRLVAPKRLCALLDAEGLQAR